MVVYELVPPANLNDIKTLVLQESNAVLLAGKSTIPPSVFDCTGQKKAHDWRPPAIRWYDDDGPNRNKYRDPDIARIVSMAWVLSPTTATLLRPVISDVAELLPLPFNDETWYFMNVFNQINDALDREHSKYKIYRSGEVGYLLKPGFFADKVPHAKLFTMQEAAPSIYYAEHHPDDNPHTFKNVVEKNELFGLALMKIWEN
ncbi:MAG: hypothetical protein HY080_12615 [Gammaproteobacteria bacterium]|nr:hypothetical protein [Gammaproteobacteria bacterium]